MEDNDNVILAFEHAATYGRAVRLVGTILTERPTVPAESFPRSDFGNATTLGSMLSMYTEMTVAELIGIPQQIILPILSLKSCFFVTAPDGVSRGYTARCNIALPAGMSTHTTASKQVPQETAD